MDNTSLLLQIIDITSDILDLINTPFFKLCLFNVKFISLIDVTFITMEGFIFGMTLAFMSDIVYLSFRLIAIALITFEENFWSNTSIELINTKNMSIQYKIYFPKIIISNHQPLNIENTQFWLIPFCALSVKQPLRFGEETGNSVECKRPSCHKYAYIF